MVDTDKFEVLAIKASGKEKKAPYKVVSENRTEYWTMNLGFAKLAVDLNKKKAKADAEYVKDAEGYYILTAFAAAPVEQPSGDEQEHQEFDVDQEPDGND